MADVPTSRAVNKGAAEPKLDERLARAMAHPTRAKVLSVLSERTASPKELEGVLGISLSNLAYHCRELLKFGCIEVVDREQIRGAMKTRYRATTRMLLDEENWERLSKETRSGISVAAIEEVIERATRAVEADTFDARADRSIITLKLDADEETWKSVNGVIREAYERIGELEAKAANSGQEKFRMTVSLLAYESPRD
ncbi:MAG TPA: helix-turn-helix domain-containing protein [Solirubrobacterales bacterium]|jgi:DNA-binding transcriptional ArsR family regulator|nr:helix-turn-helix domain-containing protein [Solirubrobacterales bacterium]